MVGGGRGRGREEEKKKQTERKGGREKATRSKRGYERNRESKAWRGGRGCSAPRRDGVRAAAVRVGYVRLVQWVDAAELVALRRNVHWLVLGLCPHPSGEFDLTRGVNTEADFGPGGDALPPLIPGEFAG